MSAVTDAIVLSRGHLQHALTLARRVDRELVDATLQHAGGSLDDATKVLDGADYTLTALCKAVEMARIAIGREFEAMQPVQSEEVAA
jgi:hypothetical protein